MTNPKYDFLATATDSDGTRSTHLVVAASATEAVAQLKAEGCTDIVLHTDDAEAASTRLPAFETDDVTLEDMVDLRSLSIFGYFLFLVKTLLRSMWITLVAALAIIMWTIFQGNQFGFLFWSAISVIAIPFIISFYSTFFTSPRKFDQLIDAWAWGRWDTVLELVPQLRGRVPDFELDVREAVAVARKGQVENGLAKITQHASNAEVARWMYLERLAEFYECIEMHEIAIDHYRQAYADAPDNPTVELDYAMALMKNETNLQEAERLIASAEEKPLSDTLQMILPFAYGLRELNNRRYEQAAESFTEAQKKLTPLAAALPVVRLILDHISAYLAIAYAMDGDIETAKQHYRPAKKRLKHLGLINCCRDLTKP
ncbi:hypothetical protein OAG71_04555 [bacterium]|nr:hypothetical protein [bacterium]